jgi:hypothetical protein
MKKSRLVVFFIVSLLGCSCVKSQQLVSLHKSFISPPGNAKPRVYWWWLFNRVDKAGITRDLEEFKAKGISGVNLICTGGYAGKAPLLGVKFQSPEWWDLFRYSIKEAKRLNIEIGFNLSAGGWTMEGPWVTPDHAMKKVVQTALNVPGPKKISEKLIQPPTVDGYYHDICVQAFRVQKNTKHVDTTTVMDVTANMKSTGEFDWEVPEGEWVILRTGYTLTGHPWSKWFAYPGPPQADTFEGGEGYEIDYLSTAALDDHFEHLGKLVIEEVRKAGGKLAYFWSDSWECGKLTWTQDFPAQFHRFRGYNLMPCLPILAGYTIGDSAISSRFQNDFDRTIQDCIAENFYGRFADLCHKNGMKMGSEAGGPNDIAPMDVLKNLGKCDFTAGEFWVNGHYNAAGGYNTDRQRRLNLKQTATAAHIYGKREAMAESFTQQEADRTHWSLGPADLKPYANDAFCEGINRIMLHQATCQPPGDGKPGFEFCAGQHFTPNQTWWQQSPAFFSYLSRCQFMLQQGRFVADVCFYLGERSPTLAPPKYAIPGLGTGYDCDYTNADVLLKRMAVKDGKIVLPDGMGYKLLVLQNCTSPSPEISKQVGDYQGLTVSPVPSMAMSVEVITKIRTLILNGATVIGAPPQGSGQLKNYREDDLQVKKMAAEIWGDLDGQTKKERKFGKGRIIWNKTPAEVLLADGVVTDFSYPDQETEPGKFDYIHRTAGQTEIYFIINRTNQLQTSSFTFRGAGRQPELWNAVNGKRIDATAFTQSNGTTSLPIKLNPFESYFVVFSKPVPSNATGKSAQNFATFKELQELSNSWKVQFDPAWGGPKEVTFPQLSSWITSAQDGIKYYSGKATYRTSFNLTPNGPVKTITNNKRLYLDLGNVKNIADIRLNGKPLGVIWCAPWRVDITNVIKEKNNRLEVDVINLWANRVIGDLNLPKEKRFTKTHEEFRFGMLRGNTPLLDAGLLGPVKIFIGTVL